MGSDVKNNPLSDWFYYTGSNCEGGTRVGGVGLRDWSRVNKDNYVTVTVANS
ncbi:hypothetical protein [Amycolatopsis sp. NPDC059657]|uniref:hypothetical protein n=1 Tax=Amycolatopsis sp. NPDC059657 TaxID=3346899 RepID=UPI00366B1C40